jgi:hypothetical protein
VCFPFLIYIYIYMATPARYCEAVPWYCEAVPWYCEAVPKRQDEPESIFGRKKHQRGVL